MAHQVLEEYVSTNHKHGVFRLYNTNHISMFVHVYVCPLVLTFIYQTWNKCLFLVHRVFIIWTEYHRCFCVLPVTPIHSANKIK